MLNKRSLRQWMPLILATLALFTSCEDKSGNLGLDVLPSEDLFSGTNQSSFLQGRNIDPVRLISDDPNYAIIGQMEDPFTGRTEASFITQATIGELDGKLNQSDEWNEYSVDSMVLNLAYLENWWIGNKNAQHEVSIHRYNTPLSVTEDYYSDMSVEGNYDETPLATRTSSAWDALPDSIWNQENYIHQWQFNLNENLANEVFNYSDDIMTNRKAFREAFGSLFVKSELIDTESQGSLVLMDLLSTQSNMELFYSYTVIDSATNEVDTTIHTSYVFPINIECLRINRLLHDQKNKVSFEDPDAEHLVVQGMAGSMVEFDFNEVEIINEQGDSENLFDYWEEKSNTESNKEYYGISAVDFFIEADTVPQYADNNFYSPVPQTLRFYEKTEDGKYEQPGYYYNPSDDSRWSPEFSGGNYSEEAAAYQFRMAGETFKMMVEKPELRGPYYLSTPDPVAYPWKVILKNSDDQDNPTPKIRLKYVKIQTP
jgi:hypothetical protein